MADEGDLRLTEDTLRDQIESYSHTHPNDFGIQPDGLSRIPMKKLMKIFQIKKKSSMERQNLFRSIVNDICELEMMDDIGKVLILRDTDNEQEDMGYGDAAPTIQSSAITQEKVKRDSRFKPPAKSDSVGAMSIATTEGITTGTTGDGGDKQPVRRTKGYKRRGSVTRYSIVAQDAVVDEYKKHEDVINQFRTDSKKIESSMRKLSIGHNNNNNNNNNSNGNGNSNSHYNDNDDNTQESRNSKQRQPRHSRNPQQQDDDQEYDEDGNAVQRFFRRGRFSLAF